MSGPNFFIVGAAKSGTSALYQYVSQHPEIYMSPVKEPHFFCFDEMQVLLNGPGDRRRIREGTGDWTSYRALFAGSEAFKARGEGSTTYLDSERAASRIFDFDPRARIVVILRNPVERAYASYMHLRRDGAEWHTDFGEALQAETERIRAGWEHLWRYQTRQYTYEKLKRYFDTFPRESIRVYLYDEWERNNLGILKDLFCFLQVKTDFVPDVSTRVNVGGVPRLERLHRLTMTDGIAKRLARTIVPGRLRRSARRQIVEWNLGRPSLSPSLREQLSREFRADILRVQDLIEKDLGRWLS